MIRAGLPGLSRCYAHSLAGNTACPREAAGLVAQIAARREATHTTRTGEVKRYGPFRSHLGSRSRHSSWDPPSQLAGTAPLFPTGSALSALRAPTGRKKLGQVI